MFVILVNILPSSSKALPTRRPGGKEPGQENGILFPRASALESAGIQTPGEP
jgi:hypothetical protein